VEESEDPKQRNRGLQRRVTQTLRLAGPAHGILQGVGWQDSHDEEKILYATSLLRDDAGTWITPYAVQRIRPTRNTLAGFEGELQSQFGVIDAKAEARIKLKNMK